MADYWSGRAQQSVPAWATAEGTVVPLEKPVYVVGGFMRSGTSMMMRALEAAGMEACYRQSRDVMKDRYKDEQYDPNIGGLYELERGDYQRPDFPHGYEGKLIKCLQLGPARMRTMPGGIRVVFMRRDAEEIRQSYSAFFGGQGFTVEQIEQRVERAVEEIRNRRDTVLLEVPYRAVVEDPATWFTRIANFFHRDLDINAAVEVVDDQYLRYRREELTLGVV